MFSGVMAEHIDIFWPQAGPLVQKALAYADGKFSLGGVYEALIGARMNLWLLLDPDVRVAVVTEIQDFPHKRVCTVAFAGADDQGHDWPIMMKTIEEFAKWANCDSIEIWGRKGWEKVLSGSDFRFLHTVLSKNLR